MQTFFRSLTSLREYSTCKRTWSLDAIVGKAAWWKIVAQQSCKKMHGCIGNFLLGSSNAGSEFDTTLSDQRKPPWQTLRYLFVMWRSRIRKSVRRKPLDLKHNFPIRLRKLPNTATINSGLQNSFSECMRLVLWWMHGYDRKDELSLTTKSLTCRVMLLVSLKQLLRVLSTYKAGELASNHPQNIK